MGYGARPTYFFTGLRGERYHEQVMENRATLGRCPRIGTPSSRRPVLGLLAALLAASLTAQEPSPETHSARGGPAEELIARLMESWRWRAHGDGEGLDTRAVTALLEDSEGLLWAASDEGLHRYDAYRWETLSGAAPIDSGPILQIVETGGVIYSATERELWRVEGGRRLVPVLPDDSDDLVEGRIFLAAGDRDSAFVIRELADGVRKEHYRVHGTRIDRFDASVRMPRGRVRTYRVDGEGTHWLATDVGIIHSRRQGENRWVELQPWQLRLDLDDIVCARLIVFEKQAGASSRAPLLPRPRASESRAIWGLFHPRGVPQSWVLARADAGEWRVMGRQIREGSRSLVEHVFQDADENYFATCDDGTLYALAHGEDHWVAVRWPEGQSRQLYGGLVDREGLIWFRQRGGRVVSFDGRSRRWRHLPRFEDMEYPQVRSLLQAADGRIWLGTSEGVFSYTLVDGHWQPREVRARDADVELLGITGLAEDSLGNLWVSSAERFTGAYFYDGKVWQAPSAPESFRASPIRSIVIDSARDQWFLPELRSQKDEVVIFRRSPSSGFQIEPVPIEGFVGRPVFNDLVRAVPSRERPEASIWIASDEGLLECEPDGDTLRVRRRLTVDTGLSAPRPWAIEPAADGALWLCYWSSGSGVTRIDGASIEHFGSEHGLGSGHVLSVVSSGFDLWFGTQEGLTRFDGACWYSFPVASLEPRKNWVYSMCPLSPGGSTAGTQGRGTAAQEPEGRGFLIGTLGDGVWLFENDDRRRPQFTRVDFPDRAGRDGRIQLSWTARDWKNDTPPERLLYRYRLDAGPWSRFEHLESATLSKLDDGVHTFEVEVRDLAGNQSSRRLTHRFRVGDSRSRVIEYAALSVVALGLLGFGGHVLRRRMRQRSAERRRYRKLFRAHPAAVFIVDAEDRIVDLNRAALELPGMARVSTEDWRGKPLGLLPPLASSASALGDVLSRARHAERARVRLACRVHTSAQESASTRSLEVLAFRERADGADPAGARSLAGGAGELTVLIEDRTEAEQAEQAADRDRRLQGLRGLAERFSRRLADDSSRRTEDSEARLAELGAWLEPWLSAHALPAHEKSSVEGDGVDLVALLEELASPDGPLALDRPRGVEIEVRGHLGLWRPRVGRALLESVFTEILRNAIEASGESGRITVSTDNLRTETASGILDAGTWVEVVVRDEGPGIDPGFVETMFDPFVSSKSRDEHEGLGLSVAWALVRSSGGDVRIDSWPGSGTACIVLLPARGSES